MVLGRKHFEWNLLEHKRQEIQEPAVIWQGTAVHSHVANTPGAAVSVGGVDGDAAPGLAEKEMSSCGLSCALVIIHEWQDGESQSGSGQPANAHTFYCSHT